jgi:hypothetical protein
MIAESKELSDFVKSTIEAIEAGLKKGYQVSSARFNNIPLCALKTNVSPKQRQVLNLNSVE